MSVRQERIEVETIVTTAAIEFLHHSHENHPSRLRAVNELIIPSERPMASNDTLVFIGLNGIPKVGKTTYDVWRSTQMWQNKTLFPPREMVTI